MSAPNPQAAKTSPFDDIRDILNAYKQENPAWRDEPDIREIVFLFEISETKYVAALQEASDMLLFGRGLTASMVDLIANMQELDPSTTSGLPNYILRQLDRIRTDVPVLKKRSQSCAEKFDEVAVTIKDDLQRVQDIRAKFERKFTRNIFWIDVALSMCRIIVEICGFVAGCGLPAVAPAVVLGGRFLGKFMQKILQPAKDRLQEKHKKLEEIEAALREQLRCVSDLGAWWQEIERDINSLWEEVASEALVGPSLLSPQRLQDLHLSWTQKQQNMF